MNNYKVYNQFLLLLFCFIFLFFIHTFLKMIEGKEMRSDMIKELRTTHALQSPEQQEKKKETEAILGEQRARERQEHKVCVKLM